MDPVTVQELTAALVRAGRPEWRALAEAVLGGAGPDGPSARELAAAVESASGDPERVDALAGMLAARAGESPRLLGELRFWLSGAVGQVNAIGGDSDIAGPVVQARDIHGGVHIAAAPTQRLPVPRQLLPTPPHFTDRERDVLALDELRDTRLLVVSGPAGVGKTALVSRWLQTLLGRGDFPDGQLYGDLRGHSPGGPARPGEILGQFLRAYGIGRVPADLAEQAALWRSVTAGLRIAVVLDNALTAAQIRPLLPGGEGGLVVVTSRSRLTGLGVDGAAFHQLQVLEAQAAVELLARRIGAGRVEREREAVKQIAVLCAGLPLAVCLAGARMASRPRQSVSAMAGALSRDGGGLTALRAEGGRAVQTALDQSYRSLSGEVAGAYRCLGLLPVTEFGNHAAAAALGSPVVECERLLDELVEVNLLEDLPADPVSGLERYRFHDLVRAHARQLAVRTDPTDRQEVVRRVVDLYLFTATAAERLLTPSHRSLDRCYAFEPEQSLPFTDALSALGWLDTERLQLMSALRTAAERRWNATAWQLADALWPLFLRLRPYDLWIEAHEIGLAAARRGGDRAGESRMLTSGGTGLRNAGRHEEAVEWFGQALDGARRDGDRRAEAQALHGLGQSHRLAGRLGQAASYFRPALELREAIGYRRGAALTRLCLGDVALADGRPEEAIGPLSRARTTLLAENDPYDAARALAFLGRAYARARGERETAERLLRTALGEFEAAGSVHWQARVLEFLGETAEEDGDRETARDHYERSLALYAPVSGDDARRIETRLRDPRP